MWPIAGTIAVTLHGQLEGVGRRAPYAEVRVAIAAAVILIGALIWLSGAGEARFMRAGVRNQGLWSVGFLLSLAGLVILMLAGLYQAGIAGVLARDVPPPDPSVWVWAVSGILTASGGLVLATMLVIESVGALDLDHD